MSILTRRVEKLEGSTGDDAFEVMLDILDGTIPDRPLRLAPHIDAALRRIAAAPATESPAVNTGDLQRGGAR